MKTITTLKGREAFLRTLKRRGRGADANVTKKTARILEDVRRRGDRALIGYTLKFDGHDRVRISPSEIRRGAGMADPSVVKALRLSARRIRDFHMRQKERSWSVSAGDVRLGQIIGPLGRVGVYVPGGKASYPSSVLMNVIPAQVAGVGSIAVAVPAPGGGVNPHVLAALEMLGVTEVYRMGGAQAVAAFAYGTKTVGRVDKIVGPGNIYVATAKRMVFGEVDIDMIAGPSEILVIADSTANPAFIAADLLSQAEHDEQASSIMVTDAPALAGEVGREVRRQLAQLDRRDVARESLRRYGAIILVGDIDEAAALSNSIAPEHLEVMTRAPRRLLPKLRNAGAIFLGAWTPEPLGDYSAGPNHTLPTGGTARFSSPLGVYDFLKRTSVLEFGKRGFMGLAPTVMRIAACEGFGAHANAVRIRMDDE